MTNSSYPEDRAGWEHIWRSSDIPPRFQSFAPPNETVVEWAKTLPANGFVLDVGCGVGRHCTYLAGRGFRVAGMDISPSGIKLTQEACAERNIPFDGRVSDMATLPWPDATFDAALSTSTIHHQLRADMERSFAEIRRVLKPGGLVLVDFPSANGDDYRRLRDEVAAGQTREVEPNTFVDERPAPPGGDEFLPHHYSTEADVRDLLRSFEIIKVWEALRPAVAYFGPAVRGKWVAWARKIKN
jgi:SAM-dependent methyltransferase